MGHDRLELSANGLRDDQEGAQGEALREVAHAEGCEGVDRDLACFPVHQDDSSRNVTRDSADTSAQAPTTRSLTVEVLRAKLDAAIVAEAWDAVSVIAERLREIERAGIIDLEGERNRRRP